MFDNIGGKCKGLASILCWIGIICSIISGIILMANGAVLAGLLSACLGALVSWIGSFALYAIGETAEQVKSIRIELEQLKEKEPDRKESKPVHDEQKLPDADKAFTPIQSRHSSARNYDPEWTESGEGFVICPQCGTRSSIDFVRIRKKCPACGQIYRVDQKDQKMPLDAK